MPVESEELRYGSDRSGLLCGYLFKPGTAGLPINAEDAVARIEGGDSGDGAFVWLHFNLANQNSQRWLAQLLRLPEALHASLGDGRSTRVEVADGALLAVINDVRLFGLDPSNVATMAVCVRNNLIVSARHTPLSSAQRLRESIGAGERF